MVVYGHDLLTFCWIDGIVVKTPKYSSVVLINGSVSELQEDYLPISHNVALMIVSAGVLSQGHYLHVSTL